VSLDFQSEQPATISLSLYVWAGLDTSVFQCVLGWAGLHTIQGRMCPPSPAVLERRKDVTGHSSKFFGLGCVQPCSGLCLISTVPASASSMTQLYSLSQLQGRLPHGYCNLPHVCIAL
jgi:hypothetical protein